MFPPGLTGKYCGAQCLLHTHHPGWCYMGWWKTQSRHTLSLCRVGCETIVSVGPKCDEILKPGMTVLFKEYAGTKFNDQDDEYLILEEKDIIHFIK